MLEKTIVINTTPILTIVAALGNLEILKEMYKEVIVPLEVKEEINLGGKYGFGVDEFMQSKFLQISNQHIQIPIVLRNFLDLGEASVIATALERHIPLVCIDETEGRRWARIHQLNLTGSLGVLIKARRQKIKIPSLKEMIPQILDHGIWLSDRVIRQAILEDEIIV